MKKIIFLFFIFSVAALAQNSADELAARIDSIYKDPFLKSSIMGVDIIDLTAGKSLFRKNEKLLLTPASNLKIITTAAGLEFLHPDFKFQTSIYYTGEIINRTLYGNLFVKGGGDPEFSTSDLESISAGLKKLDIKEITGNLFGDVSMMDSLFWGNGWMWDDDPSSDAPYLTPLDINANTIGVVVNGSKFGEKGRVELIPQTNFVSIVNQSVTVPSDSPSTLVVTRDWVNRKNKIIVSGNVKLSVPDSLMDTTWINVYHPENYFLSLLKKELESNGIAVDGENIIAPAPGYAVNIFNTKRSLDSVVVYTNKISYNLGAEMILYSLAEKFYGKPAHWQNGVKMIDSLISLCGMNPGDYKIVDGSGVSHYNLITSELIVSVLKFIYLNNPSVFKIIYSSFPVAGVDGTLKNRMLNSPAQNNVHGKTGSLSGASSLSGYLHSADNHIIAFSIIINNFVGSAKAARNIQDEICNIICSMNY